MVLGTSTVQQRTSWRSCMPPIQPVRDSTTRRCASESDAPCSTSCSSVGTSVLCRCMRRRRRREDMVQAAAARKSAATPMVGLRSALAEAMEARSEKAAAKEARLIRSR